MSFDVYLTKGSLVRLAVLRGVVSSCDLVRAVAATPDQPTGKRTLVSFAQAGLYSISLQSVLQELRGRAGTALPSEVILFAPNNLSYGIARMIQAGTGLGALTSIRVERDEAQAMALAGLPDLQLKTVLARNDKQPDPDMQTPAPRDAGRA